MLTRFNAEIIFYIFIIAAVMCGCSTPQGVPAVVLRDVQLYRFPGVTDPQRHFEQYLDCNSPAHWDGDTMYMFYSASRPYRSNGPDVFQLSRPSERVIIDNERGYNGGRWIEATCKDDNGVLYGWYHREPGMVCQGTQLTAPQIGALVSTDNGKKWRDLGIVLKTPDNSPYCETANKYFAGGNGDFTVILDRNKRYFYFVFDSYYRDPKEQGVSLARMPYADRDHPVGKVRKWYKGSWSEPGLGGHVSPIFPAEVDWHKPEANAFWGPSIHWNTYLQQYVILLNRAKNAGWQQEGIYISFNPSLSDPHKWSQPEKIIKKVGAYQFYPQVMGLDAAVRETDKLAGRVARLFVSGKSKWEIVFLRPEEKPAEPAAASKPAE